LNHIFNEKLSLFYGIGSQFLYTWERYAQYVPLTNREEDFKKKAFTGGLNANAALRYINGNIILLAGCIFNYDAIRFHSLLKSGESSDLSMFGIRPFFSIGYKQ
jgi:hypothetical protein